MKWNLKNNKGYVVILLSFIWPLLIGVVGICVDGSKLIYYQSRLMAATKLAAVSASTHYKINQGKIIITATKSDAESVLKSNFSEANISNFSKSKNNCTVETKVNVDFVFLRIFTINSKTISESYTATKS